MEKQEITMETTKAIKIIKDYVLGQTIIKRLGDTGIGWDLANMGCSDLAFTIFDLKDKEGCEHADKLHDDFWEVFEECTTKYTAQGGTVTDPLKKELLTATAIDIYAGWKAVTLKQTAQA